MRLGRLAPFVFALFAFVAGPFVAVGAASAGEKVEIDVIVIEATKTAKTPPPKGLAKPIVDQIKGFGFTSIRIADRLTAHIEKQGSVSLEFKPKGETNKERQMLKVTMLSKKADVTKLEVALPSLDFSARTEHKKGGTFLVAAPAAKDSKLFLAVTPKQ